MKFLINKSFKTNTVVTSRVLQVAEAFGLGIDGEKEFVVYDNFPIELEKGDIVYITGDSGGGKSVLMKELKKLTNGVSTDDIVIDYDKPIIETIGVDVNQALYFLSLVGLSDAFICLRKFGELSDGQKSRFVLAKMLELNNDYLFVDEFCAILDRTTAKIVSYGFQKICRKLGKVLVVATTHGDIIEDLNPSVFIKKSFGDTAKITQITYEPRPCSIVDEIEISLGETHDYHELSKFHYRTHNLGASYQIYRMTHKGELIGVIVYSYGPLALKGRNTHTDRYKGRAKLMNKEVKMISRVVMLPKYRGIGLSVELVKHTMPMTGMKYIEILSVMGKHNPFAIKAGMTEVEVEPTKITGKRKILNEMLEKNNFDSQLIGSVMYNEEHLENVTYEDQSTMYDCVVSLNKSVYGGAGKQRLSEVGNYDVNKKRRLAELIKSTQDTDKVYAIWENPDFTDEQAEINMREFEIQLAKDEAEKAAKKEAEKLLDEVVEKTIILKVPELTPEQIEKFKQEYSELPAGKVEIIEPQDNDTTSENKSQKAELTEEDQEIYDNLDF